ncbi:glyceraldehyde-3-phosphate dehydrogenase [Cricetulus griseus]|nr:glyceraldehyde-3-phosphate dehydrogenase [Cricetulus griseus]
MLERSTHFKIWHLEPILWAKHHFRKSLQFSIEYSKVIDEKTATRNFKQYAFSWSRPMTSVAPPLSPTANTESIPGIETAEGLHSPRRMVAVKIKSTGHQSFGPEEEVPFEICSHTHTVVIDLHISSSIEQKYDFTHGKFNGTVKFENGDLVINGKAVTILQDEDTINIKWSDACVKISIDKS